ncbi:hypothetical protein MMC17_003962 [Xylographa soralifera]|nr:hypothetical protein [Xylographa soralifera]
MEHLVAGREDMDRSHGGHSFTASHLSQLVMEGDPFLSSSRLELVHQMLTEGREAPTASQESLGRYPPSAADQRSGSDTNRQRISEPEPRQSPYNLAGSNWNFDTSDDMFNSSYAQEGSLSNAVANWRAMNSLTTSIMQSDFRLSSRVSLPRSSSHQANNEVQFQGRFRDNRYYDRSNHSRMAEVALDSDSDDDLTGGVPLHHEINFTGSSYQTRHSHTTTSSVDDFSTNEAPSPSVESTKTSTCDLLHSESSDTDMDMHLDEWKDTGKEDLIESSSAQEAGRSADIEDLTPFGVPDYWIPASLDENTLADLINSSLPVTLDATMALTESHFTDRAQDDDISSYAGSAQNDGPEAENSIFDILQNRAESFSNVFFPGLGRRPSLGPSLFATLRPPDPDSDFESNLTATEFFEYWKERLAFEDVRFPPITGLLPILDPNFEGSVEEILVEDLDYEQCDYQGLDWSKIGAKREDARAIRNMLYCNYRNYPDMEDRLFEDHRDRVSTLPTSDNSFRFRRFMPRHKAKLAHFQLRHLLAAPTKNAVFFPTAHGVSCADTTFNTQQCVMDFAKCRGDGPTVVTRVSTLAASDGVVVIGGYEGEYAVKSLFSADDGCFAAGLLTRWNNNITNHVHTFLGRRSGLPQVVFCSNDSKVRVLDCYTDTVIQTRDFGWIVNCSVTSPDGRLRLIVGDDTQPVVVDAESGRKIVGLERHHDYGFACDWSPNGVYMATGNQDGSVQIWDARNWNRPLLKEPIGTEVGGARSLHFSPVGGGRPVLLMAEPADIVSVVDAVTFETSQRFDFFGEIGGTAFVPGGSSFFVANTDQALGGLFEFERVQWDDFGKDDISTARRLQPLEDLDMSLYRDEEYMSDDDESLPEADRNDWIPDEELDTDPRVLHTRTRQRYRGMGLEQLVF